MKTKRSKACDIPPRVKQIVWERDHGACVVCGNRKNVMPNAHYISRADGGLGIEENIVTLCTGMTENRCHFRYDSGSAAERQELKEMIRRYLQTQYPGWDETKLVYRKGKSE